MDHWLPIESSTPPTRSPYDWSAGGHNDFAPAASACCVLPSLVGDRVRRDPKQPRGERNAAPFELAQMRERPLEHLRRDVLCGCAIVCAAADEGVYAVDVAFIQLDEPRRISLRRLNQEPVIVRVRRHVFGTGRLTRVTGRDGGKLRPH
jgi:hypothetical protein